MGKQVNLKLEKKTKQENKKRLHPFFCFLIPRGHTKGRGIDIKKTTLASPCSSSSPRKMVYFYFIFSVSLSLFLLQLTRTIYGM